MQTGQVSIWVPIVVGIIGLVGVIAGQFVSAWREDRRWTREQQREDVRWKRELERENLSRASADRAHWRDKKFEIYNDFLAFMKQWRDLNYRAVLQLFREGGLSDETGAELHRLDGESFEHRDKIELIANDREAQKALVAAIRIYADHAGRMRASLSPVDTRFATVDEFVDANEALIDVVIAAIRIDLGISDDADQESLALLTELAART